MIIATRQSDEDDREDAAVLTGFLKRFYYIFVTLKDLLHALCLQCTRKAKSTAHKQGQIIKNTT